VSFEDRTKAIRAGEELDTTKLEAHLTRELAGKLEPPFVVEQFPSGHSNLTYLVRARSPDGQERELVLRRPPFGNRVKSAHDMGREHRVLSALHPVFPKAPRPVLFVEDEAVIGAPFYLMERIPGIILRRKLQAGFSLEPVMHSALVDAFVDTLVELHELPYEKIGLEAFGKPSGYVERQVSGWTKRYADAKTDDVPDVEKVAAWLAEHLPVSPRPSLIHNDFKYDNLVLDPADKARIVGVLDWEMATVGDPLMDLGTALSYWVEATDPAPIQSYTFGPTNLPGSPTRRDVLACYAARRPGIVPDDMRFYYVFALFKNAVVAQQIYARFKRGATKDERFAALIFGVRILAANAAESIETGTI